MFGAQAAMGGHLVNTMDLERAKVKIGWMSLVYSMKRLVQLIQRDTKTAKRDLTPPYREGAL